MGRRLKYKELAKGRVRKNRNFIISEARTEEGELVGYSTSDQLEVKEAETEETVKAYFKNGLGILDSDGLLELLRIVEDACKKANLI